MMVCLSYSPGLGMVFFFSFFGIVEWCSSSKLADITPRSCHCRQLSMDGLPFGFDDVELDVD